jgi:hypothetical protein
MKLRHAAAFALVGWYLMVPPSIPGAKHAPYVNDQAPLSMWSIFKSYDSARACEHWRSEIRLGQLEQGVPEDSLPHDAITKSNCISSNDPRLAK